MAFRFEADLTEPVANWLQGAGYDVRAEVPILGRRADLVGSQGTSLTAIEMKLDRWAEALRQAMAYQLAADRAWVAMPLAAASRPYRQRWVFESQGVGLLAVDDHGGVRSPIPAAPSPRLLPFAREKVLEGWRTFGPQNGEWCRPPTPSLHPLANDSPRTASPSFRTRSCTPGLRKYGFVDDASELAEPSYAPGACALRGAQKG
ncbi:MAG TPA: hypothetical protein VJP06_03775 [Thermoplasmata archaeon]|nr:hypothetical protein [Thermoplasmata archaeon]